MIRILLFLFTMTFLGCASPRTLMVEGNYDRAISAAVRKLRKNPEKEKHIIVLEKSYNRANQLDEERITFLRKEGNPDSWDDIYQIYYRMKARQDLVMPLLPLTIPSDGRTVNFKRVNYDEEIIQAKQKAALYYYTLGKNKLESGNRQDARDAYNDFIRVKSFYPDFQDVNQLITKAQSMGTAYVLLNVKNSSDVMLPYDFDRELKRMNIGGLDGRWVTFHTQAAEGISYAYSARINIGMIDVTPERVQENAYTESREVQDGFDYVLDKNGNVMKDSLGNDIKVPKIITISAQVLEMHLYKAARISGSLEIFNNETGQLIYNEPIQAETFFENHTAQARGNLKALKPETREKLNSPPVPFPPDLDMLMQCGEVLKSVTRRIIDSRRHLFV